MGHRQIAFAAVFCATAVGASGATAPKSEQSPLEQEVRAARETTPPKGLFQTGTGFYVADGSLVLTSAHVVAGCRIIMMRDVSGREQPGTLLLWDGLRDIAVLRPDRAGAVGLSLEETSRPFEKFQVFAQSFEQKKPIRIRQAVISKLPHETVMGPSRMLEFDAGLDMGMSGAPIVNEEGNAIGMVTARIETGKGESARTLSLGVPAADLTRAVSWADSDARSDNRPAGVSVAALILRVRCQ